MYNTIDKSKEYFLYDILTKQYYYIGMYQDLVAYIAKYFVFYDGHKYTNRMFDDINMNFNDTKRYLPFFDLDIGVGTRRYVFIDGDNRIIDVRDMEDDALTYRLSRFYKYSFYSKKKSYKTQYRKHHSSNTYKHKMPRTKRTKTYNSDPSVKQYVRKRDKIFPTWWDDTNRRISCSWKDQYKCKKQWGRGYKKSNNSIRYQNTFLEDVIDDVWEEYMS